MRTASERSAPRAAQTILRFSRQRRAWSAIEPSTSVPVSGSSGTWPEQNSSPLLSTAWLYGPAGAGAPSAMTGWRWWDIGGPFLAASGMRRKQRRAGGTGGWDGRVGRAGGTLYATRYGWRRMRARFLL